MCDTQKWRLALGMTATVFFIYLATWGGLFMGYEEETARASMALLRGSYEMKRAGLGAGILYLPFAALARLFSLSLSQTLRLLTLVPLVFSALTSTLLFFSFTTLGYRPHRSALVVGLVSIGSVMWPYSRIGMEYQAMFYVTALFLALVSWQAKPNRSLWLAGGILALLASAKSYGVLIAMPTAVFVGMVWQSRGVTFRQWRQELPNVLRLFLPLLCVVVGGIIVNIVVYHRLSGAYALTNEFQVWTWWEGMYGIFFSIGKSIFLYSPLLIPAVFFWPAWYRKHRAGAIFILLSGLVLFAVTAPFSYWADETLSVRKLVPLIPLFHVPLILALEWVGTRRWRQFFMGILLVFAITVQLLNSLYVYWNQLQLLRDVHQDTLTVMRYDPQFSHLQLHAQFFSSYVSHRIFGTSTLFVYREKSWFRCCSSPKAPDVLLRDIQMSLRPYETPTLVLLERDHDVERVVLLGLVVTGLLTSGIFLYRASHNI